MMHSLLTKTLYDKRFFVLGWSFGLMMMVIIVVSVFPALSQGNSFEQIAESLPEQLQALIGDAATFNNIPGYLATQLYGIRIPLFLMIMALVLSQSLSVNEEEKGLTRTLLATPLSRGRIILEKWLAGCVIFAIAVVATAVATYIGLSSIGETAPHDLIWSLALLSFIFSMAAFTIPFGVALATGSRSLTMFIGVTATIGSFLLTSFEPMVAWLEPWGFLSLLHYYNAGDVAKYGLDVFHIITLTAITIVFLTFGWLLFRNRDISGN